VLFLLAALPVHSHQLILIKNRVGGFSEFTHGNARVNRELAQQPQRFTHVGCPENAVDPQLDPDGRCVEKGVGDASAGIQAFGSAAQSVKDAFSDYAVSLVTNPVGTTKATWSSVSDSVSYAGNYYAGLYNNPQSINSDLGLVGDAWSSYAQSVWLNPRQAASDIGSAAFAVESAIAPGAMFGRGIVAAEAAETTTQNVFWSGGRAAENAARSFANANNGIIIGDTAAGQSVAQAMKGVPWSQARPQWLSLSEDFARSASGEVNVFQNSQGLSLDSIWRSEYKILQQNPNVTGINYHVVMPDGAVIKVP